MHDAQFLKCSLFTKHGNMSRSPKKKKKLNICILLCQNLRIHLKPARRMLHHHVGFVTIHIHNSFISAVLFPKLAHLVEADHSSNVNVSQIASLRQRREQFLNKHGFCFLQASCSYLVRSNLHFFYIVGRHSETFKTPFSTHSI